MVPGTIIKIRSEKAADYEAIFSINSCAFKSDGEARLVSALREQGAYDPNLSLVAEKEGHLVGHILFSPVEIVGETETLKALGLGPMAVLPEYQRQGIGSKLIKEGLSACRQYRYRIVFVVGHPRFYPRFGFLPASAKGFKYTYQVPDDIFMVQELTPGGCNEVTGTVKYHPEFMLLGDNKRKGK